MVLAVSTDDLSNAAFTAADLGLPFPVLYNPSADVVRHYGVYNLLRDGLATPSTFVIDSQGVIRWKFVGRSISDRQPTQEVLRQLKLIADG